VKAKVKANTGLYRDNPDNCVMKFPCLKVPRTKVKVLKDIIIYKKI
jgi:hypothetical protein